jgi:alkylation response protein AidB-like acyl-CoA dehydrogenase
MTMEWGPTDDERMLVDALATMLERAHPIGELRRRKDGGFPAGHIAALWPAMLNAGFAMPQLPQDAGGVGLGYAAAGRVSELLGRFLATTPFLATALAIELIKGSHTEERARLFEGLVDGSSPAAFAFEESERHSGHDLPAGCTTSANGRRICGHKRAVIGGASAKVLLVTAASDRGPFIAAISADAPGVTIVLQRWIDASDVAEVVLSDVALPQNAILLAGDSASVAISRALDVGRALLAAELMGLAQEAFDRTVAYLKQRKQFGRHIGSFQALQHRAARLHVALELTRGVVIKALRSLDSDIAQVSQLCSLAKAVSTRTARHTLNEAVQLHGGIGVTDALDIGLFFKRSRVAGELLGDDYFHAEQLARHRWGL